MLGYDVYGATLGIVGFGRIGRAVARRAQGFGMSIVYTSRSKADGEAGARQVDLPTLLAESDFVSLHVPLGPETYHLIDASALQQMKRTAILVNAARGGVVDPGALFVALRDGL